jgi:hypothetical protein
MCMVKDAPKKAEEYDEKTHQKDCLDPRKAEFLKAVEQLLEEKYGLKKFDWLVGDRVEIKHDKLIFNNKTFSNDLTLRANALGTIVEIEHDKTSVQIVVEFDALPNHKITFYGVAGTDKLIEQLTNTSTYDRKHSNFTVWSGGTSGSSTGVLLNNNINVV